VGNIFKLGTRYSTAFETAFLDADGVPRPIVMGSYGIGVRRLLACIAEEHHDERGLVWPTAIAPFAVSLVSLGTTDSPVDIVAREAYRQLQSAEISVLLDDRSESPGVKFAAADLIGALFRVTVSTKSIAAGGLQVKRRDAEARRVIPRDSLLDYLAQELSRGDWGGDGTVVTSVKNCDII
jgi:prolyl-tRNA synthetase